MPEEPFDDRMMPAPADPWRTIDRPVPTVNLGEPTAALGGPSPGDPDRTVSFGAPDRTVRLSGPPPAPSPGPTLHGGAPSPGPAPHGGGSEPTIRSQGEMRFGPGVPVAPVAAPAWPRTAPAGRPLTRRLVSFVSSLLTLALVVVVGFYLWQRLRPLEVEGVTVAVPRPAGNRCDVPVDVVATVRTNGRGGEIRYQWFRSDSPPGPVLTERTGSGQRTATLTLTWTFSGVGTATETATVNIIEPSPAQATASVAYRCRR